MSDVEVPVLAEGMVPDAARVNAAIARLVAERDDARAALARFRRAVDGGHCPSLPSDLYPEDDIRFCDLDNERWPCSAAVAPTGRAALAETLEVP